MAIYYITREQARRVAEALLTGLDTPEISSDVRFINPIPEIKFATLPDNFGAQEVVAINIVHDRSVGVIWP